MTTEPVVDWAKDYDIFDPGYVRDPAPVWDELRGECPVAHTERWGGSWMPTRYEDVVAIAHDVDRFSSREITVAPRGYSVDSAAAEIKAPPISSDPPEHLLGAAADPPRLLTQVGGEVRALHPTSSAVR